MEFRWNEFNTCRPWIPIFARIVGLTSICSIRKSKGKGAPLVSHSTQMKEWGYQNVSFIKKPALQSRRRRQNSFRHIQISNFDWHPVLPVFAINHQNDFCEYDFRGYTSFLNNNTIDIINTQNELCWNVVQVAKKWLIVCIALNNFIKQRLLSGNSTNVCFTASTYIYD